jgi:hypothetical protein
LGLVVCFDQILRDGAGFPEGDVGVWVDDGGHTAVGVDFRVVGRLEWESCESYKGFHK